MIKIEDYLQYTNTLFNDEYYKAMDSVLRKKTILTIERKDK